MRLLAYVLVLSGILCFADAIRDQRRGIATVNSPTRNPTSYTVRKIDNPKLFEGAMLYQWSEATIVVLTGLIVLGMFKRADQADPFGKRFNESKALDDLERSLDAEQKRRRRPFHVWHD